MPNPRLENYVQVNERIVAGTPDDLAPILSICVEPPAMLSDSMGYIRCRVTLTDGRHADGTASFDLALSGKSAQATNPLEDCETSAVGRALAFLGYHANRSIASREEVDYIVEEARPDGKVETYLTTTRLCPTSFYRFVEAVKGDEAVQALFKAYRLKFEPPPKGLRSGRIYEWGEAA